MTLVLVISLWLQVLTMRANSRFVAKVETIKQSLRLPEGATLLREKIRKQGLADIDNGPSYSATYAISGQTRRDMQNFYNNIYAVPDEQIRYSAEGLLVNVYLWPSPDWSRMNSVGRDAFYEELNLKPVNEFSVVIN